MLLWRLISLTNVLSVVSVVLLGVFGAGLLKVLRLDGDNRAWAAGLIMKLFGGKSVVVTESKGVRRREK